MSKTHTTNHTQRQEDQVSNYQDMTDEQLHTAARKYRNSMLEGGEGYNPYDEEIERRADEAWRAKVAADPKLQRAERKDAIRREINILDCSIARESGTYDEDAIIALRAELDAIESDEQAEFLAEWTPEVTKARRAEWNAKVKAGQIKDGRDIIDAERELGYRMSDIKRAVKANNL